MHGLELGDRIRLAHAALQATADGVGADVLHIKGYASMPGLYRVDRVSTDADVLVRPEHVHLDATAPNPHDLTARVERLTFRGERYELHLRLSTGDALLAYHPHALGEGQQVRGDPEALRGEGLADAWRRRDLDVLWHPCTQMREHPDTLPLLPVARGDGAWLVGPDGRRTLDAVSSWWVNLFGHAEPRIAGAMSPGHVPHETSTSPPGASPTIASQPPLSPKPGTGALNQSGCAARNVSRCAARRGISRSRRSVSSSRTCSVCPSGAPNAVASSEKEYCVLEMTTGSLSQPLSLMYCKSFTAFEPYSTRSAR